MIKTIVIYLIVAYLSEKGLYKLIRRIDKKERARLQVWEDEYINKEIEKIKQNKLNYKTTKRRKEEKENVSENIISDNTNIESNC